MLLLLLEIIIRCGLPPFYSFSLIEKICKERMKKDVNDYNVRWFLANFYVWYRKYTEARNVLEHLLKLKPDSRGAKLLLARVFFNLREYEKVEEILSTSEEILSETDKENYYLGESLIELNKFNEGITYLEKYMRNHPKDYLVFVRLGYAYYSQGFYEDALKAYKRASTLKPNEKAIQDTINSCSAKLAKDKKGDIFP